MPPLVNTAAPADEPTVIAGVEHIDRGYFDFAGKLARLGADIERISSLTWS